MARLEKIYDVYFNGIKKGTGTKKELSKMLLVSPHSVDGWVKNGMANSSKKNAVKVAIVNEKAIMENILVGSPMVVQNLRFLMK